MNFDKLPCDIKRKIFDCNREAAMRESAQIENNKKRYDEVMGELQGQSCCMELRFECWFVLRNREIIEIPTSPILSNIRDTRDLCRHNEEEEDSFGSDSEWDYGEIDVAAEYREMVRE